MRKPISLTKLGLLAAVVAFLLCAAWEGLLATTSFSAKTFERATGEPWPSTARVIRSEYSNRDANGDHDGCAIIELAVADHARLLTSMKPSQRPDHSMPPEPCSKEMIAEFSRYPATPEQYRSWEGGGVAIWSLARHEPMVLIQYSTW